MKQNLLIALLCIATASQLPAQDTILKRTSYKLTLPIKSGVVYEQHIEASAYVLPDNTIQLYPGETVYIEVTEQNGIIKNLKAVPGIITPANTITLRFMQNTKNGEHESMMLSVNNPFTKKLIYNSKIYPIKIKKWVDTDIYPVEAGMGGYEMWPDVIATIGLNNFRLE